MESLVKAGLMEYAGRKSFVPEPFYRITSAGHQLLRWVSAQPSPDGRIAS